MSHITEAISNARRRLLQMHYESKVGHIGGNLSCLDALMVLHHQVMHPEDTFVLSKGHSAGALYITLWSLGILKDDDLRLFHKDNTKLAGHPAPKHLPQIPFATGSLGHGLSLAAGIAMGKRLTATPGRVYCLLSDGEWQEGSNWEALIFASHHKLPITMIVDTNGLQGFGATRDIASQESLAPRFCAFNVPTVEIDGHNPDALRDALLTLDTDSSKNNSNNNSNDSNQGNGVGDMFSSEANESKANESKANDNQTNDNQTNDKAGMQAVVAITKKGCGVSFMENKMEWHYLPLTQEHYELAIKEVCGNA